VRSPRVIPAQAGIHTVSFLRKQESTQCHSCASRNPEKNNWIPASAGMTYQGETQNTPPSSLCRKDPLLFLSFFFFLLANLTVSPRNDDHSLGCSIRFFLPTTGRSRAGGYSQTKKLRLSPKAGWRRFREVEASLRLSRPWNTALRDCLVEFPLSLVGSLPGLGHFVKHSLAVPNVREKALGPILEGKALGPIVSVLPNAPEGETVCNDCSEPHFPILTPQPPFT